MQAAEAPETHDYYEGLKTPNVADMQLQLEELVQQGSLSPEQAQTILLERSSMNSISTDPRFREAQIKALSGLEGISDAGGMTLMDDANLAKIASDEQTQARGAREAILQNARARGMGGSGLELISQLKNQQDSATRQSQRDLDIAGMAEKRALDALIAAGQQSGQMQAQDFGQQAQVAQANDAISKFNAQNTQNQVNLNTGARNDAAAKNLAVQQSVADQNTATRNAEQQYNTGLVQQNYENRLKKRSGQSGIDAKNAEIRGDNSQRQADANNQNARTALSIGSMFMSDEREKENVESFDASRFLDDLVPRRFDYKDKTNGPGRQAGVMAQDLLKSDVGAQMVEDTPEGLMVDSTKATGPILAGMADLHERLKKLEGGV